MNREEYIKISELLKEFCIPKHLEGYKMIMSAIKVLSKNPDISVIDLYTKVAEMHNSTVSRTERAIRYAIESGYDNCKMCGLDTFKRICYSNGKPSNNEFLKSLCFEYEFTD